MENIIIGVWQIPRFLVAKSDEGTSSSSALGARIFTIVFFSLHYGLFTFIHGSLLFQLFLKETLDMQTLKILIYATNGITIALLGLFISHGIQFFNDLFSGRARNTSLHKAMMEPYSRIVVLHLVLLGSAFVLTLLPYPAIGLILLTLIKIGMDIHNERKIENARNTHGP